MNTIEIKKVLLKRGNTAQSEAYTGLLGEVTIDTDLQTIRVHDGLTPGGNIIPATQSYIDEQVSSRIEALLNGAPEALDTLKELADALGNNSDSITDILTTLATKADLSYVEDINTSLTAALDLKANIGDSASTGDITFDAATIGAPDEENITIQARDGDSVVRSQITLDSYDSGPRISAFSNQDSWYFDSGWDIATWTNNGYGYGVINFANAQTLIDFLDTQFSNAENQSFSINGGEPIPYDGAGWGGGNLSLNTGTLLPDPDPTTVTTIEFFYNYESYIAIDYDNGDIEIIGRDMGVQIESTNNDININAGDDLRLYSNDRFSLYNRSTTSPIEIVTDDNNNSHRWAFNVNGSLTFPDNTIQTTAYAGNGNPFDQDLNTTDAVEFLGVTASTIAADNISINPGGVLNLQGENITGVNELGASTVNAVNFNGNLTRSDSDLELSSSNDVNINTSVGDENHKFEFKNDGTFYMAKNPVGNDSIISTPRNDTNANLVLVSAIDVKIETNEGSGSIETWTFKSTGVLEFPDGTVQSTAWTGSSSSDIEGNVINVTSTIGDVNLTSADDVTVTSSAGDTRLYSNGILELSTNVGEGLDRRDWIFGDDGTLRLAASSLNTNMGMIWSPADGSIWLSGTTVNKTTDGNGVVLNGGQNDGTGRGGGISLFGGNSAGGTGGSIFIETGIGQSGADNGVISIGTAYAKTITIGNGSNQTIINGNLTFNGARTISPVATTTFTSSDITIQGGTSTDLSASGGDVFIEGGLGVGGGDNGVVRIDQNAAGGVWIGKADGTGDDIQTYSRLRIHRGVTEDYVAKADATGVVEHDCDGGHLFYHTSPLANWTVNLTNLNAYSSMSTNIVIVIEQGGTPYYPSALQIGGAAQTIKWLGNVTPTPQGNKTEIATFTIFYNGSAYNVLGSYSTYG